MSSRFHASILALGAAALALAACERQEGARLAPVAGDAQHAAADAHSARTGAHVGHCRAMPRAVRALPALLPLLLLSACDYQTYQSTFSGNAAAEVQQFNILFVIFLV